MHACFFFFFLFYFVLFCFVLFFISLMQAKTYIFIERAENLDIWFQITHVLQAPWEYHRTNRSTTYVKENPRSFLHAQEERIYSVNPKLT